MNNSTYQIQECLPDQNAHLSALVPEYSLFYEVVLPHATEGIYIHNQWEGVCLATSVIDPQLQQTRHLYLEFICCNEKQLLTPKMVISSVVLNDGERIVEEFKATDVVNEQTIIEMAKEYHALISKFSNQDNKAA